MRAKGEGGGGTVEAAVDEMLFKEREKFSRK